MQAVALGRRWVKGAQTLPVHFFATSWASVIISQSKG